MVNNFRISQNWIAFIVSLAMLLAVGSCTTASQDSFIVHPLPDNGAEITLHYASPEGVYGYIEFQGFTVMSDMTESLRLQIQALCDDSVTQPPDLGHAKDAGLYRSERNRLFAPICVYDGVRPEEVLDAMASSLSPRGYWYVASHEKEKRIVTFRTRLPRGGA